MADTYPDIEAYYTAVPEARHSGETDYGVWWWDAPGAPWRVSWVDATGDLYAVQMGPPRAHPGGGVVQDTRADVLVLIGGDAIGQVEIIGYFATEAAADAALDGWAERCGQPDSLQWIKDRASG